MPKCPVCGSLDMVEAWNEDDFRGLKGETEARCEICGAEFRLLITMVPKNGKKSGQKKKGAS